MVVVSAPSLARGTRASLLSRHYLRGGPYTRTTLSQVSLRQFTLGNLIRGAKGSIGVGLLTSLATNLWDFTVGTQRETGVLSKEFAVSTGVDLIMSVGTGLVAAGIVAGAAALFTLTLPVSGAVALTAGVGVGMGLLLDATGAGRALKREVSEGMEAWPGIVQNGRVIAQVMGERAAELASNASQSVARSAVRAADAIRTAAQEVTQTITSTAHRIGEWARGAVDRTAGSIQGAATGVVHGAQEVASSIQSGVSQAVENAREFLGNLFGGGD